MTRFLPLVALLTLATLGFVGGRPSAPPPAPVVQSVDAPPQRVVPVVTPPAEVIWDRAPQASVPVEQGVPVLADPRVDPRPPVRTLGELEPNGQQEVIDQVFGNRRAAVEDAFSEWLDEAVERLELTDDQAVRLEDLAYQEIDTVIGLQIDQAYGDDPEVLMNELQMTFANTDHAAAMLLDEVQLDAFRRFRHRGA